MSADGRDVEAMVHRLGGRATWRMLRATFSAAEIRSAVAQGRVVRGRRGRYVSATADEHRRVAHETCGTLSHLSAATAHGWSVKKPPDRPWVTYRRKRHLTVEDRDRVHASYRDLESSDVRDGVTGFVLTVVDCARVLPFDEALTVADSALRDGDVTKAELLAAAGAVRGHGAARARRVARLADARSANPLESVLRAVASEFAQLHLEPQHAVWDSGLWARVDLGDPVLRLALEAEGFQAHRTRKDLHRDARRYTELAVWQWTVLRFSWEDVMLHPDWVRWAIGAWLEARRGRPVPPPPRRVA